jgi:hypothetical protein
LTQAFDLYKEGCKQMKGSKFAFKRAIYFMNGSNTKMMRRVYEAWADFILKH